MKSAFGTPEKLDSADLTIAAYERIKENGKDAKKGANEPAEPAE